MPIVYLQMTLSAVKSKFVSSIVSVTQVMKVKRKLHLQKKAKVQTNILFCKMSKWVVSKRSKHS